MLTRRVFASNFIFRAQRGLSSEAIKASLVQPQVTSDNNLKNPPLILKARSPSLSGSRKSRKLRESGLVPGVLYGLDDDRNVLKAMVTIDQKTLLQEIKKRGRSFENTVYHAEVRDENDQTIMKYPVTPCQTQFCALTEKPLAVNFLRHLPTNRVRIPIKILNSDQSVDIRRGCFVVTVSHYLDCICDDEVPQYLTIDLSNAKKGDIYRLNSVELPPKVRPARVVPPDQVLCVIKSARK